MLTQQAFERRSAPDLHHPFVHREDELKLIRHKLRPGAQEFQFRVVWFASGALLVWARVG